MNKILSISLISLLGSVAMSFSATAGVTFINHGDSITFGAKQTFDTICPEGMLEACPNGCLCDTVNCNSRQMYIITDVQDGYIYDKASNSCIIKAQEEESSGKRCSRKKYPETVDYPDTRSNANPGCRSDSCQTDDGTTYYSGRCDFCAEVGYWEDKSFSSTQKCRDCSSYSTSDNIEHCIEGNVHACNKTDGTVGYYCTKCEKGYVSFDLDENYHYDTTGQCVPAYCGGPFGLSEGEHCTQTRTCLSGSKTYYACEACEDGYSFDESAGNVHPCVPYYTKGSEPCTSGAADGQGGCSYNCDGTYFYHTSVYCGDGKMRVVCTDSSGEKRWRCFDCPGGTCNVIMPIGHSGGDDVSEIDEL